MQVAGLSNRAADVTGAQLSGLFNVAANVHGIQVAGLVNVADSNDYPIGLVNLVKNGSRSIGVGLGEAGMALLTFRSGGKVLYGLVGVGYKPEGGSQRYGLETGLGAHLLTAGMLGIDAEVANLTSTGFKKNSRSQLAVRLLPQLRIGRQWGVAAGPALTHRQQDADGGRKKELHIGLYGGLTYVW